MGLQSCLLVLLTIIGFISSDESVCYQVPKFHFPDVKTSWLGAVEYCNRLGMWLAVIDKQFKHDVLMKAIKNTTLQDVHFWLGASDQVKEGTFIWHATGMKVDTGFIKWSNGQPDNYNKLEHCMEIVNQKDAGGNWSWNDRDCSGTLNFVCETDIMD